MEKLTSSFSRIGTTLSGLRYSIQLPASSKSIRKMAEAVNHQDVHDLLVEIARKAGDMIAKAQPHVNTSGSKKNCLCPPTANVGCGECLPWS
jgi:hypothetical protein